MKSILAIAAALALVFFVSIGFVWYHLRQQRPEVIVEDLRRGNGDRQELLMKLQLARGEVTPVIARVVTDRDEAPELRRDLLELLFRRFQREPDRDLKPVLTEALQDPDESVREHAAYCLGAYAEEPLQVALAEAVEDPSPKVRRLAYATFMPGNRADDPIWTRHLTEEQRQRLVERCRAQIERETDPELKYLARSVVGREIELRLDKATEALQSGNLAAEQMILDALAMDPQNQQAQIRLARFYLATGDKTRAIETAAKHGALVRIPAIGAAPVIDGDPTDAAWKDAVRVPLAYQLTSRWTSKPCEGKSEAILAHHGGRVYIAVLGYETNLDLLSVKHTERDSDVWRDDSAELFFDPLNRERRGFQFVINPAGALWDEYDGNIANNTACESAARVFKDRGYWAAEFSVAAEDLAGQKISPEAVWGINIGRPRIGAAAEYNALWPTFGGAQQYGKMPLAVFVE